MPYRQTTVSGLPAVSLSNDTLELVAIPEAGARITHLRRRAGREWLWRNPRLPFRAAPVEPPLGPTDYVDRFDSGGWDECFPTITPGRLPDGRLRSRDEWNPFTRCCERTGPTRRAPAA